MCHVCELKFRTEITAAHNILIPLAAGSTLRLSSLVHALWIAHICGPLFPLTMQNFVFCFHREFSQSDRKTVKFP